MPRREKIDHTRTVVFSKPGLFRSILMARTVRTIRPGVRYDTTKPLKIWK